MNGFVKIRRGIVDHLRDGTLSIFEFGLYAILLLQADYRTGIWTGSAPRLAAAAPRGTKMRHVQRALRRLAEIFFIRVFRSPGKRGNYRVLIHKFESTSPALKGKRLNALKSMNWREPVFEDCADDGTDSGTDAVTDGAPYQEEEGKEGQEKSVNAQTLAENRSLSSPSANELSRKPDREVSPDGMELACLLRQRVLENNPRALVTEKRVVAWAHVADLMLSKDKRTTEEISGVIAFSQGDDFWKGNILSMKKLREHFDQLTLKSRRQKGGGDANRARKNNGIDSGRGTDYDQRRVTLPEL